MLLFLRPSSDSLRCRQVLFSGAVAAMTLFMSGCSLFPGFSSAGDTFRYALQGFPDADVTPQQALQLPYASMFARIGEGPKSLVILAEWSPPLAMWIGADKSQFYMRHGIVERSAGLTYDLTTSSQQTPPWAGGSLESLYVVDFKYRGLFGLRAESTWQKGEASLQQLDSGVRLLTPWEQQVRIPLIDWEIENTYWVDEATGFVWASQQTISPDMPALRYEILKPPAL
jgi:hypothetical protein